MVLDCSYPLTPERSIEIAIGNKHRAFSKHNRDRRRFLAQPLTIVAHHRFAGQLPITGILSATVKYCILFRVVYFSMFLLETRFYDIYEELSRNVTKHTWAPLLRYTVQVATKETCSEHYRSASHKRLRGRYEIWKKGRKTIVAWEIYILYLHTELTASALMRHEILKYDVLPLSKSFFHH